jgi:hypothetical protein
MSTASTRPATKVNERIVETPAGTIYITTIETDDHKIKVRARMIHDQILTVSGPVYSKAKATVIKEAEEKAIRTMLHGAIVPKDLLDITRELNVLLMECIISSESSPHLEDIKIRRMDLCDKLGKLQEMARGAHVTTDAGPSDN